MTKNNLSKCLAWLLQETDPFPHLNLEHLAVHPTAHTEPEQQFSTADNVKVSASQEAMARLQLAPQSAVKPRILAQSRRVSATSVSDSPKASSPAAFATVSRSQRTPARAEATTSAKTPVTNYDDSVFDIDDLEAILGDEGQDLTTSSYGDFGTPCRLWTENAASRIEPLSNKKGRKRKSDEYFEDAAQSSHRRKEQSPFPRVHKSGREHASGHSQDKAAGLSSRPNAERQEMSPQCAAVSEAKTMPRKLQSREEDPPQSFSSQDIHPSQRTVVAVSPEQHELQKSARRKLARAVVPDSDEDSEDIEGIFRLGAESPQVIAQKPRRQSLIQSSPVRVKESPSSQNIAQNTQSELPRTLLNNNIERLKRSKSPSQGSTPVPSKSSPASSNPQLSQSEKDLVARFMKAPASQCNEMLRRLDVLRSETSKEIANQIYEHEFYSEELKETMQSLKARIEALHKIIRIREDYALLCKERDSLKLQLAQLIAQDLDFDQSSEDLKLVKAKVNEMEATLYTLIMESGWSQNQSGSGHVTIPSDDEDNDMVKSVRKDVLVASTQHSRKQATEHSGPTGFSSSTQPITQTPLGPPDRVRQPEPHYHGNDHVMEPTYEYQRPSQKYDSSKVSGISRNNVHKKVDRNEGFTRSMGSPLRLTPSIDEFEDAFDDEEAMLHAAEAFDNGETTSKHDEPVSLSSRPVLSSVSGNARRMESSRHEETTLAPPAKHYPWTKDVDLALRKRFHLQGFRHNQLEAINATLGGKDAFVLMPTGGGKSLCYQLPSIVQSGRTRGVTVVISPLLSLMQDQVDHLQKLKVQAYLMNGESTSEHKNYIYQALRDPQPEKFLQLLYITPEMLGKSQKMIDVLTALHKRKKLARIVIDEAHCVSQWGHDFRPDYKGLGDIRRNFAGVPVMALTATATENVKVDVISNLGMDGCEVFNQSFNRPNLSYEVREKVKGAQMLESVANTINTFHRGQSGIVYCLSRKNCESVAEQLRNEHGIKAAHYHAGMDSEERIDVQKQWQSGRHDVIVATIAFGMGIDKPDVRFVIHYTIPKSLEGYYQETGRAGRDGLPSQCYLYYGYGDTTQLRKMIKGNKDASWDQQERQLQMLRNVVQFCENKSDCRRFQVLAYFNEHFDRAKCNETCDNCKSDSTFEVVDFTQRAKDVISLVRKVEDVPVTLLHCVDIYRGAKNRKITDTGHDELDEFGRGSDLDRGDVERLFYRLVSEEALQEWNKVNRAGFATQYVKIGPTARDFIAGRLSLKIQVRTSPRPKLKQKTVDKGSRKKNRGTGVQAADDYPASTNISSPIDSRKSRQKPPAKTKLPRLDEDSDDNEYFEGDLASFAPVRQAGAASRVQQQPLGPPITSDYALNALNTAQRNVLDDFMREAARYFRGIILNKSLKQNPVPDSVLREIGIVLPQTMGDLAKIPGMTLEKVKLYGPKILDLVKTAHETYNLLVQANEDQPVQQGRQSIVEITDDDDDEAAEENFFSDDDFDVDELENTESSHYFSAASDQQARRSTPTSQSRGSSAASKSRGNRRTGSQSRMAGAGKSYRSKNTMRRTSVGKPSGSSKVTKRSRNSGPRSNGSTSRNSNSTSKSRTSATQSNRGSAIIGMMPT